MKRESILKKFIYILAIFSILSLLIFSLSKIISVNQESENSLHQDKTDIKDTDYLEQDNAKETSDNEEDKPDNSLTEYEKAQKYFTANVDLDDYRHKYNNREIVARLEIPNIFNILVTQAKDNKYYLNHSLTRKKDDKGTEFMDYRTSPTSKQVNIYGHNSRTYNIPFRKLERLLDKDSFEKSPYVLLQHDDGIRIYKIMSIKETTDNEHMYVVLPKESFLKHIRLLLSDSLYTRNAAYDESSNILILQTCSYNDDKTYYIITAIEIKPDNK